MSQEILHILPAQITGDEKEAPISQETGQLNNTKFYYIEPYQRSLSVFSFRSKSLHVSVLYCLKAHFGIKINFALSTLCKD